MTSPGKVEIPSKSRLELTKISGEFEFVFSSEETEVGHFLSTRHTKTVIHFKFQLSKP